MTENRRSPRYKTLAHVRIPKILEGDNLLKNMSITGCCVECTGYINIKPLQQYRMEVIPESVADIGNFKLHVEAKWIHSTGYSSEVGFSIVASPTGKQFQRYVDYLVLRHAAE